MNRLTALLAALMAFALMTGPAVANEFSKQLSPNTFGTEFAPDGVSEQEFRGIIDTHYGVAPAWGRSEESLMVIEKTENDLRRHLAPNTIGSVYFVDGMSDDLGGTIDKHYGVAPAWEDRPEDLTMVEKAGNELRKHLAPNTGYADYGKDIF